MDTTTDTIRDPQGAGSLPRELCFELLEPVFDDNDVVGRTAPDRPNHQEPAVVRGHRILLGKSAGCVSRSLKEYRRAPDCEGRIGINFDCHEVAGRVAIEQLRTAMGPERLRAATGRNGPLPRTRVRKGHYVDLVLPALVGAVGQPSPIE